jgi:hypothetical protein
MITTLVAASRQPSGGQVFCLSVPHAETSAPGGWDQAMSAFVRVWENLAVEKIWNQAEVCA